MLYKVTEEQRKEAKAQVERERLEMKTQDAADEAELQEVNAELEALARADGDDIDNENDVDEKNNVDEASKALVEAAVEMDDNEVSKEGGENNDGTSKVVKIAELSGLSEAHIDGCTYKHFCVFNFTFQPLNLTTKFSNLTFRRLKYA